jgi:hypothetical protein
MNADEMVTILESIIRDEATNPTVEVERCAFTFGRSDQRSGFGQTASERVASRALDCGGCFRRQQPGTRRTCRYLD